MASQRMVNQTSVFYPSCVHPKATRNAGVDAVRVMGDSCREHVGVVFILVPAAASRVSPQAHTRERIVLCGVRSDPLCPRFECSVTAIPLLHSQAMACWVDT